MELDELKTAWKSISDHVDTHIDENTIAKTASNRNDIRTRLLRRFLWDAVLTSICMVLMATSPLWSPLKLPVWWLIMFCAAALVAVAGVVRMYRTVRKINLWHDTGAEIMSVVISIRKLYRSIELATAAVIAPLLLWLSFTPVFINSWRMIFVWALTLIAFGLEYILYRSNIRQLNDLK